MIGRLGKGRASGGRIIGRGRIIGGNGRRGGDGGGWWGGIELRIVGVGGRIRVRILKVGLIILVICGGGGGARIALLHHCIDFFDRIRK